MHPMYSAYQHARCACPTFPAGNRARTLGAQAVLKSRNIPSMAYQFWKLCLRTATKQCRSWPYPIIDICLLVGAAHIIGFIHGTSWRPGRFPNNVVMAMTALGVLSTTIHIRTLDQHHALFAREVSSGARRGGVAPVANTRDVVARACMWQQGME
jgi:hypothetical protein